MSRPIPDEAFELVLTAVADGESVQTACKRTGACNKATFFNKVRSDPQFARRFTFAMEERAEARQARYDDILSRLEAGSIDPSSARVLLESLRWQMGRDSARYSDKVKTEISGPNETPLFPQPEPMSEFEQARYLAYLLSKADKSLSRSEPLRVLGNST